MRELAIRVAGLSKAYRLTHESAGTYRTLRDDLVNFVKHPLRYLRHDHERFWALKDVSFDVRRGEVLGIIGRNGAGKSTVLKLLARITRPTSGYADVYGRVASLLEVGTGFHAELTGRENIELNGAILGMSRAEVKQVFDEIVAFAEVEKFLDTPVKRYSSGMYMRLAVAVAAHLRPEILLVDEVLSVGDTKFQEKCLGKMSDLAHDGRTILFVSHQLNAVQALCSRCIWLDQGGLRASGDPQTVIADYLGSGRQETAWVNPGHAVRNPYFLPQRIELVDMALRPVRGELSAGETFGISIQGVTEEAHPALTVGFSIFAGTGEQLFWALHTDVAQKDWVPIERGVNRLVAWIPAHLLNEGEYRVELIVSLHFHEWISQPGFNAPSVTFRMRGGLSDSPYWVSARPGLLAPMIRFEAAAPSGGAG